jgi:hypothetical protein
LPLPRCWRCSGFSVQMGSPSNETPDPALSFGSPW